MCDRCGEIDNQLDQVARYFHGYVSGTRTRAQKTEDQYMVKCEVKLLDEKEALLLDHWREAENDPAFLAMIEEENQLLQLDIASEDSRESCG